MTEKFGAAWSPMSVPDLAPDDDDDDNGIPKSALLSLLISRSQMIPLIPFTSC